jgi:hypothetical protein
MLASQAHVITRSQAVALGISVDTIRNRVRCADWQQLLVGVYADFTGIPKRETQVWAALLRAGPGAVVSHWTAAERHGLMDKHSAAVHLTVSADRHPARRAAIPGVVVHRSRLLDQTIHPAMSPPCTRVEHTVIDLIEASATFEQACVEIDGAAAHPMDEQWRDKDRDRWNAVHQKIDTIRIGVLGLRTHDAQCATAADVATWLSGRGPATGHPCTRAGCPVPLPAR